MGAVRNGEFPKGKCRLYLAFPSAAFAMSDSRPTITDVIGSGRWRRAVFTTFTISLTYFECYVLPRLRAQGCNTIDVFVDALGYRDSLVEQRSRHAGRDYTVHPVLVPSGIFHPKLIYLWAEEGDDDVLLVGSGNLTYAGHGGSLEVFEILRPTLHAQAYGQAGAFVGQLVDARDQIHLAGATAPLDALSRRLLALAGRYPNVQDVQFLHSLQEPAVQQLAREIGHGPHDELLVMSPYHHPLAEPIRSLVEATRPNKLFVVQDGTADGCPFPFDPSASWPCDVVAVESDQAENRSLHAKWYEWRRDGRATTFTGSFNATIESLATSNNVECGVLRRGAKVSSGWSEADPLPFAKQGFPRNGASADLIVTGELCGRMLTGQILGYSASVPREWQFSLQSGELPPSPSQRIEVDDEGAFQVQLAHRVNMDSENGLQIRMQAGSASARGWIALPDILKIGSRRRTLLASLSEVGRGTESPASFAGFLSIVMDEIRSFAIASGPGVPPPRKAPPRPPADAAANDDAEEPVGYARDAITDAPASRGASARDQLMAALAGGQNGWAVWGQLSQVLLGASAADQAPSNPDVEGQPPPRRPVRRPENHISHPELEDDADQEALEKEQYELRASLASFQVLIGSCRDKLHLRIERAVVGSVEHEEQCMNLAQLERLALHVMLRANAGPLRAVGSAQHELAEWLHRTVNMVFSKGAREMMLPDFAGCAAVLAYQNRATPQALMDSLAQGRAPSKVMRAAQYLEAVYAGAPEVSSVLDLAANWLSSQTGFALVRGDVDLALLALEDALQQPTPRSIVSRFFEERPQQLDLSAWRPFSSQKVALLREAVRAGGTAQRYSPVDVRAVGACRVCSRDLRTVRPGRDQRQADPSMLAELKLFCVTRCDCGRGVPLINQIALPQKP
jgi:hypothetical protein